MDWKRKVAVDLDGTLAFFDGTWHGIKNIGAVLPGAAEGVKKIREQGFIVVIYTARFAVEDEEREGLTEDDLEDLIRDWLDENGIEYDEIMRGKPAFFAMIDDRAVAFKNWDQAVLDLNSLILFKN